MSDIIMPQKRPKTSWFVQNGRLFSSNAMFLEFHHLAYYGHTLDVATYTCASSVGNIPVRRMLVARPNVGNMAKAAETRHLALNHTKIYIAYAEGGKRPVLGFVGSGNFTNPTVLYDLFVAISSREELKQLIKVYEDLWKLGTPITLPTAET